MRPVFLDMDNVLVDFEQQIELALVDYFGATFSMPERGPGYFSVETLFPAEHKPVIRKIMRSPGFFLNMKPLRGAEEAYRKMLSWGWDVRILSAPIYSNAGLCLKEKYEWLEKWLGEEAARKSIFTRDKAIVSKGVLVDDNPELIGKLCSEFQQILFDAPYNRHIHGVPRIHSWEEGGWEQLLKSYVDVI